mmetsp:Transcript_26274/g.29388  ORF Transcript_26274/g.29388 Transcript_26274/m.29388 type:complete len:255 (-) Transcript_26274:221-985(-)
MKVTHTLFIGLAAVITATAAEFKMNIYEGPRECDDTKKVKVGDKVGIHYTGTIDESSKNGEPGLQFDSSRNRDMILDVTVGYCDLIDGWDIGLIGICKGAKAILIIPPEMGYGSSGVGDGDIIPGGATLKFDVEVVSVTEPPPQPNLFDELDIDQDGVLTPEEIHVHFRKENPNAEMPPDLMEKEDKNKDGVVSREEFGGPSMPWEMCLEMLHGNSKSSEITILKLSVLWLCQRPRDLELKGYKYDDDKGNEEL